MKYKIIMKLDKFGTEYDFAGPYSSLSYAHELCSKYDYKYYDDAGNIWTLIVVEVEPW